MNQLKNCPFCGGEARLSTNILLGNSVWLVQCRLCTAKIEKFHTKEQAVNAWNSRKQHEATTKVRFVECFGDLFNQKADAICLTTNGCVRADGAAVMGRGCALQAKRRWPGIEKALGQIINEHGNHCAVLKPRNAQLLNYQVVVFPVKHAWNEPADLKLIERSAKELMQIIEKRKWRRVVIGRPGCGNGNRNYEREVKPILAKIFDERVNVITFTKVVDYAETF